MASSCIRNGLSSVGLDDITRADDINGSVRLSRIRNTSFVSGFSRTWDAEAPFRHRPPKHYGGVRLQPDLEKLTVVSALAGQQTRPCRKPVQGRRSSTATKLSGRANGAIRSPARNRSTAV